MRKEKINSLLSSRTKSKIESLVVDERITTITGILILIALWTIYYLDIITIDVCISTSVFPAGLIVSKDKWFGIKTKKR